MDFVFGGIILVSVFFSLKKGLAREIISLVALIGGFILAVYYYKTTAGWLSGLTRTTALADLIGFLAIFLGCLLVGAISAYIVNRLVKAVSLEWIDRILGAVFGLLRGWAVASILLLALIAFPVRQDILVNSYLAPFMLAGARTAVLLVPQELKDRFNEQYRKVLQAWNRSRNDA
jgi:membrane protein required for colicin V production